LKQKTHPLPFNEADVFSFVVSGCDKSCDNNRKSGCLSHFSAFLTYPMNQGVSGSSPFQRTKKPTSKRCRFFVFMPFFAQKQRKITSKALKYTISGLSLFVRDNFTAYRR